MINEESTKRISIKNFNHLRIDSTVMKMIFPKSIEELKLINFDFYKNIMILGNGTNTLFLKEDYGEDYLFINTTFLNRIEMKGNKVLVESGVDLDKLVWFCVENGLGGIEFLEDIPGTVGGAIVMNAGTFAGNIGKFVKKVNYYDIEKSSFISEIVIENCFQQRSSKWASMKDIIITSVELELIPTQFNESISRIYKYKTSRLSKQPRNYPNLGSVFVRPIVDSKEVPVWELLDELGLRGHKIGNMAFSEKHPGFIINLGNGTAKEAIQLIDLAKKLVKVNYDIDLINEWKLIK